MANRACRAYPWTYVELRWIPMTAVQAAFTSAESFRPIKTLGTVAMFQSVALYS